MANYNVKPWQPANVGDIRGTDTFGVSEIWDGEKWRRVDQRAPVARSEHDLALARVSELEMALREVLEEAGSYCPDGKVHEQDYREVCAAPSIECPTCGDWDYKHGCPTCSTPSGEAKP